MKIGSKLNIINLITSCIFLFMKIACGCTGEILLKHITAIPTELSTEWASGNAWNCGEKCDRILGTEQRHPQVL
jgi:hypothetical protein